jgi:hypothetical protein
MVRLRSTRGWISIRQVTPRKLLKLVKVPRVRQGATSSIFSSSVNEGNRSADNHTWPPLGWRARVGQEDRLEASATVPRPAWSVPQRGLGIGVHSVTLSSVRQVNRTGDGGVGDRTLSNIGRAEPSGDLSSPTRSRRGPTNSLFTRGHRDDQCGTSSCLGPDWPKPASGISSRSRSWQSLAPSSSTGQSFARAPGTEQGFTGGPGSE